MKGLTELIKKTISEAAKINFAGHKFILKVDTNEDPQKKGVKVFNFYNCTHLLSLIYINYYTFPSYISIGSSV